ncbi:MAG: alpha/beta fold hydrolase [Candidatus Margulisiibacteriota bacterium]
MKISYSSFGKVNKIPNIIIHGLFGSKQNWTQIAKSLSEKYSIITVDCRNHGESFHSSTMSYTEMATDIVNLMNDLNIKKANILGHSMGGKIAMAVSQLHPKKVNKQIIIDIAPKQYPPHHTKIISALTNIDLNKFKSRSDVNLALKESIPNDVLRQFLIKNIQPKQPLKWQINLDGIAKSYSDIMDWPENLSNKSTVESLFIRGTKSNYVELNDESVIKNMFSNCQIRSIDASHWVHAEKPTETIKQISDFIN